MKPTITLIILLSLSILFIACAVRIPEGGETPAREGEYTSKVSYAWGPCLEEGGMSFGDSEIIVADVTITGWLGELDDYGSSFFSAKVNEVICGSLPDSTIVVSQAGTSRETDRRTVFYTKGNRLMLVLSPFDDEEVEYIQDKFAQKGEDAKDWLIKDYVYIDFMTCDIVELDGELLVLDRLGHMTSPAIISGELTIADKSDEAVSILTKRDAALAGHGFYSMGAIAYDDFAALAKKYCVGN